MANIIKIKRSVSGTSAPSALARGELAYSEGGEDLYIGSGTETGGAAANIVKVSSGFGIADLDAVRIDDADAADNDYAKFTANGLEGRNASEARTDLSVDVAGTDNSTNVTLAGTPDYITLSGQVLTRGAIVLTTDVSGVLPAANTQKLNDITAPDGSVSMNSQRLTGLAAPVAANDAARKADVDAAVQGLDVRDSARAASTGNLTLSGTQTIDGVSVIAGDRVLAKNQSTGSENGIYVCAASTWARSADLNHNDDCSANMFFFIEEGSTLADTGWVCTTNEAVTLANMVFAQFSGTGSYTAGNGLDLTGTAFSLDIKANGGLVIDSTEVTVDLSASAITGTLDAPDGGTGLTAITENGIMYGKGAGENSISVTAAGANNAILYSNSGVPTWTTAPDGLTIDCGTF